MDSAIYLGKTHHSRFLPKPHKFSYRIFMFWLNLTELDEVHEKVRGFSLGGWAPFRFRRSDYLGDPNIPLQCAALKRMSELAGKELNGTVYLLAQVRMFGLYFSPVNFYYLKQDDGQYSHLLAEVSNTPWNERHHYLVDLNNQQDQQKCFHVSPFNPMDMQYQWHINPPNDVLTLSLICKQQEKHFAASIALKKIPLNSGNLFRVLLKIPSMTLTTVGGIYWQALRLWLKGNPVYDHPGNKEKDSQC